MFVTHSFVLNDTNRMKVPIKRSHPSISVHRPWTGCSVTDRLPFLDVLIKPRGCIFDDGGCVENCARRHAAFSGPAPPSQGFNRRLNPHSSSSSLPPSLYLFSRLMPRLMLDEQRHRAPSEDLCWYVAEGEGLAREHC